MRMSILPKWSKVALVAASTAARSAISIAEPVDAVGFCDALHRLLEQRPVAVPYGKPGAGGEHAIGDRKADALRAAGDDRDPLFQIIDIHDMPLWSRVDA